MKLLHYTYRKLSLLFLLLVAVWGVLFYCAIVDEVVDETDDTLENYARILVEQTLEAPSILRTQGTLMSRYTFRPISESEGKWYRERFYDSTVYIELEDENEPVRVFQTAFRMPDGQYYELTLMISILEREDMTEAIVFYLAALFLLFLAVSAGGTRLVLRKAFRPLNGLMQWLHAIRPGEEPEPLDTPSHIREFRELGDAMVSMAHRAHAAYDEQKQFIENASHELQTPLAIVQGKLELLAEGENLNEQQLKELDAIFSTLGRAVRLNRSLLLLSRIENGQYVETGPVDMDELADSLLPDLLEIYESRRITLYRQHGDHPFVACCNHALAQILLSNLLKNALLHNREGGELRVVTSPTSLAVMNSGDSPLDADTLFRRFRHSPGTKESTGLGLAIARSIAGVSSLSLTYEWHEGMHVFLLVKESK